MINYTMIYIHAKIKKNKNQYNNTSKKNNKKYNIKKKNIKKDINKYSDNSNLIINQYSKLSDDEIYAAIKENDKIIHNTLFLQNSLKLSIDNVYNQMPLIQVDFNPINHKIISIKDSINNNLSKAHFIDNLKIFYIVEINNPDIEFKELVKNFDNFMEHLSIINKIKIPMISNNLREYINQIIQKKILNALNGLFDIDEADKLFFETVDNFQCIPSNNILITNQLPNDIQEDGFNYDLTSDVSILYAAPMNMVLFTNKNIHYYKDNMDYIYQTNLDIYNYLLTSIDCLLSSKFIKAVLNNKYFYDTSINTNAQKLDIIFSLCQDMYYKLFSLMIYNINI